MSFQTKQNVKNGKISPKQAYENLYPLVGEEYSHILPTMKWLKNLVDGRKLVQEKSENLNKKLKFKKNKLRHR